MWGLIIGLPLGVLQVFGMMKFAEIVTTGKKSNKTIFFVLADIIILLGVFILMAAFSPAHLLWTATGMVAVMIILSVIIYIRKMKANRR